MTPHWCRTTGEIVGKNHIASWNEYHPAWEEYHSSYISEYTSRDSSGHLHTYTTYHPSYTEHHPDWIEHHPDIYTFILANGKTVNVDVFSFDSAEKGDWWGYNGFYGTKLIKMKNVEK